MKKIVPLIILGVLVLSFCRFLEKKPAHRSESVAENQLTTRIQGNGKNLAWINTNNLLNKESRDLVQTWIDTNQDKKITALVFQENILFNDGWRGWVIVYEKK